MGIVKDKLTDYVSNIARKPSKSVAASDYTAIKGSASGVPINAQWRDGKVSVGGILIEPEKVVDGKAIVNSGSIDNALQSIKDATGVESNSEILSNYDKYKKMYDKQLKKLTDRDDFSYDPNKDDVYQSYKNQYNREGNRATENTMGTYSTLTGGLSNSSALTAAAQAGQYWNEKLMDVIPQLAEDAYNRYAKEFEMDRQALSDILGVDTHLFDREYSVNRDTIGDIQNSSELAYEREVANRELNLKQEEAEYQRQKDAMEYEYNQKKDEQDYQQDVWNRAFKLFEKTGNVPSADIAEVLGIPIDTITADIKTLFEKLAHETNQSKQDHSDSVELQNIKHKNTIKEIYARKN